jgi:hypothetical protein
VLTAEKVRALVIADCEVDFGKEWPLIPDGTYEAIFTGHETSLLFGRAPKIYLHFRLVCSAEHDGKELYRAYPVNALKGKPGRNGRFKLTKHQDLYKTLCRLLDLQARTDRLSLQGLKGRVLRIRTRTVKTDYRQTALPTFHWYSVVDSIEAVLA